MFAKTAVFVLALAAFVNAASYPGTPYPLSVISPAYVSRSCRYSCKGVRFVQTVRRHLRRISQKTGHNQIHTQIHTHLRTQIHTNLGIHQKTRQTLLWSSRARGAKLSIVAQQRFRRLEPRRMVCKKPVEQLGSVKAVLGLLRSC